MNIKILDSWLREYLKTDAKPKELAEKLSLTSASIERIEKYKNDYLYDIEVTTNRPDLMSVVGLAREATAVLPQFGIDARFTPPKVEKPQPTNPTVDISIINDDSLVYRVLTVVMEVKVKSSPEVIKDRLESTDIRSLNNLIDVTNYVMRTVGHPTHVFDFDRLNTNSLTIRQSKKGESVQTLDNKTHTLPGGDIVAEDDKGRIIDLLAVMGLENSVVTEQTKRILFFIDNVDPVRIRKTSMSLALRSEAAQLNEKEIDPELARDALELGIRLYKELAEGKIISDIIDIYPRKPVSKTVTVSQEKINTVIGVPIPLEKARKFLEPLGFKVIIKNDMLNVQVPSWRADIKIPEDIIEEIARVYGYHNLPSILPPLVSEEATSLSDNPFYWEERVKHMLKYWGFTEVYTYSMVAGSLYEGPLEEAVMIKNPLDAEHVYMRKTLVPSLLEVIKENKSHDSINIFEIANVYLKKQKDLPVEKRMLAGVLKKENTSFAEIKGVVEQLAADLNISLTFKPAKESLGADVFIGREMIGTIEELDENLFDFELGFEKLTAHATLKKAYTPIAKYPPIIEDLALIVADEVTTGEIIETIKKQSPLINEATLLDKYKDTRTFHIVYQNPESNLTTEEIVAVREKIIKELEKAYRIHLKK